MKITLERVEASARRRLSLRGEVEILVECDDPALLLSSGLRIPYEIETEAKVRLTVRALGAWHRGAAVEGDAAQLVARVPAGARSFALHLSLGGEVGFPLASEGDVLLPPRTRGWVTPLSDNPFHAPCYTWSEPQRSLVLLLEGEDDASFNRCNG